MRASAAATRTASGRTCIGTAPSQHLRTAERERALQRPAQWLKTARPTFVVTAAALALVAEPDSPSRPAGARLRQQDVDAEVIVVARVRRTVDALPLGRRPIAPLMCVIAHAAFLLAASIPAAPW